MTLVWKSGWNGLTEPEAVDYVAAVEAADGQELEFGVAKAINDFVVGCKADGIWNAIKASCILAGARTLAGALVPLVGTAPTNNNFVSADYDRETGLKGDGSTKYLDSNRRPADDPQDNAHLSTYVTETSSNVTRHYIGALTLAPASFSQIIDNNGNLNFSFNSVSGIPGGAGTGNAYTGLLGVNRSGSSLLEARFNGASIPGTYSSTSPNTLNYFVFCRNLNGSPNGISNRRHTFYSIGESLDLALLDTRVSNLMTAIGAAIP